MAHFAKLSADGEVLTVIVVDDAHLIDDVGVEREELGLKWLRAWSGWEHWVQTSYSGATRGGYAGPGMTYDRTAEKFELKPEEKARRAVEEDARQRRLASAGDVKDGN